jgi:hypothetical protein
LTGWQVGVPRDVTGLRCEASEDGVEALGTQYQIIQVLPNDKFTLGFLPEDDSLGHDPQHRPTQLDDETSIPRNGHGGTIDPEPADSLLPGFYQVTSYKTANGDDLAHAPTSASPYSHFEIFANETIVPLADGWSFQTCDGVADCRAKPNEIIWGADFSIDEVVATGRYQGRFTSGSWDGRTCHVAVRLSTVVRDEATGALTLEARVHEGNLPGVTTDDECSASSPQIDALVSSWPVTRSLGVTATPLHR